MTAAPDLGSPTLRILECSGCSEPVWAEPVGSRVSLRCDYCGYDDARELSTLVAPGEAEETYRGARGSRRSRKPAVDLTRPPEGMPKRATLDKIRAALTAERKHITELDADSEERVADAVSLHANASNAARATRDRLRAATPRGDSKPCGSRRSEPSLRELGERPRDAASRARTREHERALRRLAHGSRCALSIRMRGARAQVVVASRGARSTRPPSSRRCACPERASTVHATRLAQIAETLVAGTCSRSAPR